MCPATEPTGPFAARNQGLHFNVSFVRSYRDTLDKLSKLYLDWALWFLLYQIDDICLPKITEKSIE